MSTSHEKSHATVCTGVLSALLVEFRTLTLILGQMQGTMAGHAGRLEALERHLSSQQATSAGPISGTTQKPTLRSRLKQVKDHLGLALIVFKIVRMIPWGLVTFLATLGWKLLRAFGVH